MKKIRALLLSAGLGTRLRPLTLKTPKCLVEINNKPILGYWIEKLENISADQIIVNTHYLSNKVDLFLEKQKRNDMKILNFYEDKLLGTAGTLIANSEFFADSLGILIHADNFTKMDLKDLIASHRNRPKNCLLTMLTFETSNPESCGVVEVDSNNIVQKFYEKHANPPGNIANAAVYLFEEDFMEWLITNYPQATDFSLHVLPNLLGRIYTFHTKMSYIDIGTKESLDKARRIT
jgi:mannose-1-phosphate guanylyltransferase